MGLFSPIRAFIACTWVLPHTPTDGAARIFALANMPQSGIELVSDQLHLFEGPKFGTLYRLSYRGCNGHQK